MPRFGHRFQRRDLPTLSRAEIREAITSHTRAVLWARDGGPSNLMHSGHVNHQIARRVRFYGIDGAVERHEVNVPDKEVG